MCCSIPDVIVLRSVLFCYPSVVPNKERKHSQCTTIIQQNQNVNILLIETVPCWHTQTPKTNLRLLVLALLVSHLYPFREGTGYFKHFQANKHLLSSTHKYFHVTEMIWASWMEVVLCL